MSPIHVERALAKLTRTLRITGRRDDGYHLLESEMVCLDFGDELEIEAIDHDDQGSRLEVVDAISWIGTRAWLGDGRSADAAVPHVPTGSDNLVMRALELADRRARVRLVKRIPPGAGLGGGSADAAAVLRWAGFTDLGRASRLGGDVPFCIRGGRALVTGIGEHLVPLASDDATYLCCTPSFGVATAVVYRAFDELNGDAARDPGGLNDLETAALLVEPRLARVRDVLAETSGRRPTLAGSGSTWFVACRRHEGADLAAALSEALEAEGGRATVNLGRTVGAFSM